MKPIHIRNTRDCYSATEIYCKTEESIRKMIQQSTMVRVPLAELDTALRTANEKKYNTGIVPEA